MTAEEHFLNDLVRLDIGKGCSVLIGLSGGGDSVALLELVHRVAEQHQLTVHAARVVHGIRGDDVENAEIELCSELCEERGIPFSSLNDGTDGISAVKHRLGTGTEQAARFIRHSALERHRKELGADFILLGHTAEDQLETILMRVFTGSGPEGLRGIPESRSRLRRPLLSWHRSELRRLLRAAGVPWAEDSTNSDSAYRRNRIRNELIPLISEIVPGWPGGLETLGERSGEVADVLDNHRKKVLPMKKCDSEVSWLIENWDEADDYTRAAAIWNGLSEIDVSDIPDRRVPWRTIKDMRRSVSMGQTWTGRGFTLKRTDQRIILAVIEQTFGKFGDEGRIVLDAEDLIKGFTATLGGYRIVIQPDAIDIASAPV
ncbi:MAG: tRNA lysidine(34) synthetase TilS, partial [Spirochaetaceae bacterium]|nr:tRNA lysidine(34) synthetase TilS [Spirochaetaceae bacterium]